MSKMWTKIKGWLNRDPAFWLQLTAAVVMAVSTFVVPLSDDQQGVINALAVAVAGIVTFFRVGDGGVAVVVGFFKALIAVGLAFGLHMSPEQQYVVMLLVQTIATGYVRTQVVARPAPNRQL